jgi:hypothetical protein
LFLLASHLPFCPLKGICTESARRLVRLCAGCERYASLLLACLLEFLLCAEATECAPVSKQPVGVLAIDLIPIRLPIGAVCTAYVDAFVRIGSSTCRFGLIWF